MRHIGTIRDEAQARVFGDFLVSRGIRNQLESESNGEWSVWVYEEDQIAGALAELQRFHQAPDAPEFREATTQAEKVRKAEAEDLEAYRKRIRTRRSVFPKFGGYGIGLLTAGLIVMCIVVGGLSGVHLPREKKDQQFMRNLYISDPLTAGTQILPEVRKGEVWRLITPIFMHNDLLHLLFNMMWLFQLGSMIEARKGSLYFAVLVMVLAICSNLAQYYVSGWVSVMGHRVFVGALGSLFYGMSGVVYGLAGFVWIRGRFDTTSGLYLDQQTVTILLIWLVVCYTGIVGPIANTAHLAGLVTGMAWGRISAMLTRHKPD